MPLTPTDPTKPQVWINGQAPNQTLDFYIPQGPKGDPGGITLGTTLNGQSNLNDYKSSGVYRLGTTYSGLQLLNFPRDTDSGVLVVYERVVNQTLVQEWHSMQVQGRGFYLRHMTNTDVWSSWRFISTARVDQSAGRAIYQWDDLNNRDQLIWGDTGLRNITTDQGWIDALTGTGVTLAASGLNRVRRVGSVVELAWVIDKPASGNTVPIAAFPLGFRPAALWNALGVTSSLTLIRAYHAGGTNALIYQSQTGQSNSTINLTYTTSDPWPTTLPGVAIGTIGNT